MKIAPDLTSNQFTFDKETNTFSAEASDLQMKTPPSYIFLKSSKTGSTMIFQKTKEEKDGEGETTAWNYVSGETMANGTRINLKIFND